MGICAEKFSRFFSIMYKALTIIISQKLEKSKLFGEKLLSNIDKLFIIKYNQIQAATRARIKRTKLLRICNPEVEDFSG